MINAIEENKDLKKEVESLEEDIRILENEKDDLEKEVSDLEDEVEDLKYQLKTPKHYSEDLISVIDAYADSLDPWEINHLLKQAVNAKSLGQKLEKDYSMLLTEQIK